MHLISAYTTTSCLVSLTALADRQERISKKTNNLNCLVGRPRVEKSWAQWKAQLFTGRNFSSLFFAPSQDNIPAYWWYFWYSAGWVGEKALPAEARHTFFGETTSAAGIMRCPDTLASFHCSRALAGAPSPGPCPAPKPHLAVYRQLFALCQWSEFSPVSVSSRLS